MEEKKFFKGNCKDCQKELYDDTKIIDGFCEICWNKENFQIQKGSKFLLGVICVLGIFAIVSTYMSFYLMSHPEIMYRLFS